MDIKMKEKQQLLEQESKEAMHQKEKEFASKLEKIKQEVKDEQLSDKKSQDSKME